MLFKGKEYNLEKTDELQSFILDYVKEMVEYANIKYGNDKYSQAVTGPYIEGIKFVNTKLREVLKRN